MGGIDSLAPKHVSPIWGWLIIGIFAVGAVEIEEHWDAPHNPLKLAIYIFGLFTALILAMRPAWCRRSFWRACIVLFLLHVMLACLIVVLIPRWYEIFHPVFTIIVVPDGLATMSLLWRYAARGPV